MNISRKGITLKKQRGVALLMSLIMLLLITVIGVSSVRMSLDDTQIAGNSIFASLVFQGAESGLNRSLSNSDLFNIQVPASNRTLINELTTFPAEDVSGGGQLISNGVVKYERILEGPQINGVANSSEFKYQVFQVTAESQLNSTSAKAQHTEGRAIQIPGS